MNHRIDFGFSLSLHNHATHPLTPTLEPSETIPPPKKLVATKPLESTPTKKFSGPPTKTQTSTHTATLLPYPTITPMTEGRIAAHPMALTAYRAAMQLKRLARFGQGALYDIAWSPDGKYLGIATGLGVYLYDAVNLELVRLLDVNDHVTLIAFSPDGRILVTAGQGVIRVWGIPPWP